MVRLGGTCAPCGLALWLLLGLAACDAARENPSVGTPGLEPPRETSDAGSPTPTTTGGGTSGSAQEGPGGDSTGSGANSGAGGAAVPPGTVSGSSGGAGIGSPLDDADGGTSSGPGDALFAGLWVVDQPSHALYEATLYELEPSGDIATLDTYTLTAPEPNYVTGTVANADSSLRCSFAGRWRTLDLRLLELDASCSDGNDRAVQMSFPDGDPALGLIPMVITVGGELGWDHRDWPWSWHKCASRDDCSPF